MLWSLRICPPGLRSTLVKAVSSSNPKIGSDCLSDPLTSRSSVGAVSQFRFELRVGTLSPQTLWRQRAGTDGVKGLLPLINPYLDQKQGPTYKISTPLGQVNNQSNIGSPLQTKG